MSISTFQTRPHFPAGLLGMLALVLAVEGFVARQRLDFNDPCSLCWRIAAADARRKAPGCDVLLVGDSLVKHGLVPQIVASRTGLRVCNLAAARAPSPFTYFVFRRALEAGARPSAVVVDFKPSLLVGSPQFNLRYWQEVVNARELVELAGSGGGPSFLPQLVLGRLFPSIRGRLEVRSNVLAALRGEHDRLYSMNRVLRQNWERNGGANVAARNPSYDGALTPDEIRKLRTDVWYTHRANVAAIEQFCRLAAEHRIKVYWLLPPLTPQHQARRDGSPAEDGYLRLAHEIAKTYHNVTILDARHAGYPHQVFVDPHHLDRQGALALSLDVGDVLRRDRSAVPSGTRWVDLPRYRARPAAVPFEDVEQTKVALTNQGALRD